MPRPAPEKQTFEWSAIAFTGLCLTVLFGLALTDTFPAKSTEHGSRVSSDEGALGARFGGRIATVLRKPTTVQYVTPPIKIQKLFEKLDYRLDDVRRYGEVPRLFLASLPPNLREIQQPQKRKRVFIQMALPLILHANELIRHDRRVVLRLLDRSRAGKTISSAEQVWLENKAQEYGLDDPDLAALALRIDIIPPSLALAQAAEESGWGTSRFAREGNAIFGQRTWNARKGIKPLRRPDGETFKVRAFDRLIDGIMSYARNLNSHVAYEDFRQVRETQRRHNNSVDGYGLAATLQRYSERGDAYVETIQMLIRVNKLQVFDRARLRDQRIVDLRGPDA